jgi:hypothetical protein
MSRKGSAAHNRILGWNSLVKDKCEIQSCGTFAKNPVWSLIVLRPNGLAGGDVFQDL